MTNTTQPSAWLDDMDTRLEDLGDEIDLIRTILNSNRRKTRTNSQAVAKLERVTAELSDISRRHQQSLRVNQRDAEQDRAEIRHIREYLRDRNGGSPSANS